MEPITDVGVDLDGVLYPFVSAFKQYCITHLKRSSQDLPEPTHWHFYEDWNMSAEDFHDHILKAAKTDRLFTKFPSEMYCSRVFKELREMGIRIHILTHRPEAVQHDTIDWLTRHDLLPHTIHFVQDKTMLKDLALGKSMLIDDCAENYVAAEEAGIIGVLHTRPWNLHLEDARRVSNMLGFLDLIKIHNHPRSLEHDLQSANH
jgi:FMN phosphatase YigB (HAD superfamily)